MNRKTYFILLALFLAVGYSKSEATQSAGSKQWLSQKLLTETYIEEIEGDSKNISYVEKASFSGCDFIVVQITEQLEKKRSLIRIARQSIIPLGQLETIKLEKDKKASKMVFSIKGDLKKIRVNGAIAYQDQLVESSNFISTESIGFKDSSMANRILAAFRKLQANCAGK